MNEIKDYIAERSEIVDIPKYEYMLKTWGGFYNEEYKKIHKQESGYRWFSTNKERQEYIDHLKQIEEELNARHLAITTEEGYHTRNETILHRVVEYDNKEIYSYYNMGFGYPISAAKYHLEYKWYPGFNDYELEKYYDKINYREVKVIQEWITGAETEKYEL